MRLLRRACDLQLPDLKVTSASLSMEHGYVRAILERRDGIWLRWKNLPDAYRPIFAALDDGRLTAERLAAKLRRPNVSDFRRMLSAMKQIGILRSEGKKGYEQASFFLRPPSQD
jgi:hypothetical protein